MSKGLFCLFGRKSMKKEKKKKSLRNDSPEIVQSVSFRNPTDDYRAHKLRNWHGVQQHLVIFQMYHYCLVMSMRKHHFFPYHHRIRVIHRDQ